MSEQRDGGEEHAEEIDLTGVPMDGEAEARGQEEGEHAEEQAGEAKRQAAEGQQQTEQRSDLSPDELRKRYDNTRTALSEERRQRRELQARLEALERGERPGIERQQPQDRREPEEIDPDVDPMGALKQMRAKIAAYEAAERQESLSQAERNAQEQRFQRVEAAFQEHETDFREDHPDYDEAAKHYAVARAQELMTFGLQPAQIQPMLREEFVTLASTAIRAGKNPAAVVYEMAKGRGYGKAAAKDGAEVKPGGGKLDALKRGQQASSPLSRTGGRTTASLDVATVANIDIHDAKGAEAFDKAFAALERRAKAAERGR
ncbi:MAG: hypothetical protein JNK30_21040 [Phenylobacterium sp.]|uniref:hypothetical protein n=1 Tax=Phenylobacterium sp. TaxID=1871053 RepID=UPI001A3A00A8|nr:hypothetical protein [Phenylobacterium sp.]MBL8773886.1 hypothetical protein [Phenylobacterium sp.]